MRVCVCVCVCVRVCVRCVCALCVRVVCVRCVCALCVCVVPVPACEHTYLCSYMHRVLHIRRNVLHYFLFNLLCINIFMVYFNIYIFQRIVKMNKSEDLEMDSDQLSEEEVLALSEGINISLALTFSTFYSLILCNIGNQK